MESLTIPQPFLLFVDPFHVDGPTLHLRGYWELYDSSDAFPFQFSTRTFRLLQGELTVDVQGELQSFRYDRRWHCILETDHATQLEELCARGTPFFLTDELNARTIWSGWLPMSLSPEFENDFGTPPVDAHDHHPLFAYSQGVAAMLLVRRADPVGVHWTHAIAFDADAVITPGRTFVIEDGATCFTVGEM